VLVRAKSTPLDSETITDQLGSLGLNDELIRQVVQLLPRSARAVLLYGSRARGDSHQHSDVDVLVIAERHAKTRALGPVSVTTYGSSQIEDADGSLFGMHLARDGVVLHDQDGWLRGILDAFRPSDPGLIIARVRALAVALTSDERSRRRHVRGMVRLARYLLRTALYAKALDPGPPCFSISGLAERFGQPELSVLLSSHELVHGAPSVDVLDDLTRRLGDVVGPIQANPYGSLEALIVAEWSNHKDVSNSALLALADDRADLPYAEIPRIVL
jgi:hypothetical protein